MSITLSEIHALADQIWERLEVSTSEAWNGEACWNWTGPVCAKGYGKFSAGEFNEVVGYVPHRIMWLSANGRVWEPGNRFQLQIDHKCRNKRCCNPAHLDLVSARTNNLRQVAAKRFEAEGKPIDDERYLKHADYRKTHCSKGHKWTEENTYITKSGKRRCRKCHSQENTAKYHETYSQMDEASFKAYRDKVNKRQQARRAKLRDSDPAYLAEKERFNTFCPKGHRWDEDGNLKIDKRGKRFCRTCKLLNSKAAYTKKKNLLRQQ